jgi:nicotinamidase-related amidase
VEDYLITPKNAALLIIDYQPPQVSSIVSMDHRTLVANIVAVAKLAKLYGVPIMLSTVNVKSGPNTPTIRQLAEVLAGINAFDRTTINAWEDEEFVAAVKDTSRKKLIMTTLWTEVGPGLSSYQQVHSSTSEAIDSKKRRKGASYGRARQPDTSARDH